MPYQLPSRALRLAPQGAYDPPGGMLIQAEPQAPDQATSAMALGNDVNPTALYQPAAAGTAQQLPQGFQFTAMPSNQSMAQAWYPGGIQSTQTSSASVRPQNVKQWLDTYGTQQALAAPSFQLSAGSHGGFYTGQTAQGMQGVMYAMQPGQPGMAPQLVQVPYPGSAAPQLQPGTPSGPPQQPQMQLTAPAQQHQMPLMAGPQPQMQMVVAQQQQIAPAQQPQTQGTAPQQQQAQTSGLTPAQQHHMQMQLLQQAAQRIKQEAAGGAPATSTGTLSADGMGAKDSLALLRPTDAVLSSVGAGGAAMKAIRMGHAHANTSSAYLGVTWYKASRRWQARLCSDNKKFHLGYFNTENEAARAYDRAVIEHKGPNAPRNFGDSYTGPIAPGTSSILGPTQLVRDAIQAANNAAANAQLMLTGEAASSGGGGSGGAGSLGRKRGRMPGGQVADSGGLPASLRRLDGTGSGSLPSQAMVLVPAAAPPAAPGMAVGQGSSWHALSAPGYGHNNNNNNNNNPGPPLDTSPTLSSPPSAFRNARRSLGSARSAGGDSHRYTSEEPLTDSLMGYQKTTGTVHDDGTSQQHMVAWGLARHSLPAAPLRMQTATEGPVYIVSAPTLMSGPSADSAQASAPLYATARAKAPLPVFAGSAPAFMMPMPNTTAKAPPFPVPTAPARPLSNTAGASENTALLAWQVPLSDVSGPSTRHGEGQMVSFPSGSWEQQGSGTNHSLAAATSQHPSLVVTSCGSHVGQATELRQGQAQPSLYGSGSGPSMVRAGVAPASGSDLACVRAFMATRGGMAVKGPDPGDAAGVYSGQRAERNDWMGLHMYNPGGTGVMTAVCKDEPQDHGAAVGVVRASGDHTHQMAAFGGHAHASFARASDDADCSLPPHVGEGGGAPEQGSVQYVAEQHGLAAGPQPAQGPFPVSYVFQWDGGYLVANPWQRQ